jgi:hypothetical protein
VGDSIEVDGAGLHAVAALCDTAASTLTPTAGGTVPGPAHQATSTAVTAGYRALDAAARALSGRASATGSTMRTAAGAYTDTDDQSAQKLSALGRTFEV